MSLGHSQDPKKVLLIPSEAWGGTCYSRGVGPLWALANPLGWNRKTEQGSNNRASPALCRLRPVLVRVCGHPACSPRVRPATCSLRVGTVVLPMFRVSLSQQVLA